MDIQLNTSGIATVSPILKKRCDTVLTLGFATCPLLRFMYVEPERYQEAFQGFIKWYCGGDYVYESGSGACYPDNMEGALLWQTPEEHVDEGELMAFIRDSTTPGNLDTVLRLFEAFEKYHPKEPYYYYTVMAIDPYLQKQGLGNSLYRYGLAHADRAERVSYCEATRLSTVKFYETVGWRVLDAVQIGSSPTYYPMIRDPQLVTE